MSGETRFLSWRGRPGIVVRNFTPLDRNGFLGRGDLWVRAWFLVVTGCLWRRLKNGREEVVLPHRAAVGEDGPAPVVLFSTKQIEERFTRGALDAFRAAAKASQANTGPLHGPAKAERGASRGQRRPLDCARRRNAVTPSLVADTVAPHEAPRSRGAAGTSIPNVTDRGKP